MGLLVLLTPFVAFIAVMLASTVQAELNILVFLAGLGVLVSPFVWLQVTAPPLGRVIEAALQRGRCASCGYEVKTVPPEADGCSICPECGAAWRLPPSPHSTPAESP